MRSYVTYIISIVFLLTLLMPLAVTPVVVADSFASKQTSLVSHSFVTGFQDNSTDDNGTTPLSEAFVDVDWQLQNDSHNEIRIWNWTDWIFGPIPDFSIYFENGSVVNEDHFIEFDKWVYLQLNIPRNLFKRGTTLGQAGLSFNTWSRNGSAGFYIGYDVVNDEYIHKSWQQTSGYDKYHESSSGPILVNVDVSGSNVTFDGQMWRIIIKFKVLSDAPVGLYRVDPTITDNYGINISFEYWRYFKLNQIEREYAVGASRYEIALMKPMWYLEVLDMDNNTISSVAKYTDFKIRITINHPSPGIVYFSDWFLGKVKSTTISYMWHDEFVTATGGWVYDANKETFVWDPNAKITAKKVVYGPVNTTNWLPQGIDPYVNIKVYNPQTGLHNVTIYRNTYYVYNFTSNSFGQYIGYEFFNYTLVDGVWKYKHFIVFERPVPDAISLRFMLDFNACSMYKLDENYVVEFVVYPTDLINEGDFIYIRPSVYAKDGSEIHPLEVGDHANKQITIGATTAFAYIVDKDGLIVKKRTYHVSRNNSFTVLINAKGNNRLISDIDGIKIRFETCDSEYTDNETRWSNLIILLTYNFIENKSTIEVYNATYRYVYVYGLYWDWVLVNKTGWHYEYDSHSAKWVWTYGTYQDWEYTKLIGWHWEYQSYDRSKGNWTTEGIRPLDQRNLLSDSQLYIGFNLINRSIYEGELTVYFNITVYDKLPEKTFQWNVELLNYTFGEDFSKPYGRYTTLQWIEDTVYSFMNESERVYVEPPSLAKVVSINGTYYLVKSYPFIVINGTRYLLKPDIYYDPWTGETEEHILFRGEYNLETNDYNRYYYILNNSHVQKITIYKIEVGTIFKYNISGIGVILSTMLDAEWNPLTKSYFLVAINGTFYDIGQKYISFDDPEVTVYEVLYNIQNPSNLHTGIFLNYTTLLNTSSRTEYDPHMNTYYVTLSNGTRLNLEFSEKYGMYFFKSGEKTYYVTSAFDYYSIEYNYSGRIINIMVRSNDIRSMFYTVINNKTFELPYPNANAFNWWALDTTISNGGKVPEILVGINGTSYFEINYNSTDNSYYVILKGSKLKVYLSHHLVSRINNETIFDIVAIGYRAPIVEYPDSVLSRKGYLDIAYYGFVNASYVYYRDFLNESSNEYEIPLLNGTIIKAESEVYVRVFIIKYGNMTLYTFADWPSNRIYHYDNNTVTYVWRLTNGTLYNVTVPITAKYYGANKILEYFARVIYLNYTIMALYQINNMTGDIDNVSNMSYVYVTSSDVLYNSTGGYYYIVIDYLNGTHKELKLTPLSSWYTGSYDNLIFYDKYSYIYSRFLYNATYNGQPVVVAIPRHSEYTMTSKAVLNGTIIDIGSNITSPECSYAYLWAIKLKSSNILLIDTDRNVFALGSEDLTEKLPIYNIRLPNGTVITIYPYREYILKNITYYGHPRGWLLLPLRNILVRQNIHQIVVGFPKKGLWNYRTYTINPENGALDLDGNLSTTEDQFYIKRVRYGTNYFSYNSSSMQVSILLDPNSTQPDDELWVRAWMGITTYTWKKEWNVTFYWYYPNGTLVSNDTLAWINSTIIDQSTGKPLPGYWDIAVYVKNYTWEDVVREAKEKGWDWITDKPVNWTWLWFGIAEHYWGVYKTDYADIASTSVNLRYEFAGIMIYNDTNGDGLMNVEISGYEITNTEATHYFIPTAVGHVIFTTPGAAYNVTDPQGHLHLPYNASITFGIEYVDVYGRTIPLFGEYGFWDWWSTVPSGSDFEGFDERPINVYIDNLLFLVHFQGNETPVAEIGNMTIRSASIKIDQHVGNWDVNITGGRSVLTNRSLAINWYVYTDTETTWQFTANGTQEISNEEIIGAMQYAIEVGNSKLAEINMGATYTWGKNTSVPFYTFSQTIPLSTFVIAYSSESGNATVTGWAILSSMYFLSVGFPQWDGFYVYNDPETVVYLGSRIGQGSTGGPDTTGPVITDVSVIPDQPGPGDEVKIRFAAYDHESGVSEVLVLYSVNGADNESAAVTALDNDYYEATLGSFNANDVIVVYIIAKNKYGITSYYVLQITISELQPTGPGGPGFEGLPIPLIVALTVGIIIVAIIIIKRKQKKALNTN